MECFLSLLTKEFVTPQPLASSGVGGRKRAVLNCLLYESDIGLNFKNDWISDEKGCPQAQECKEDI